MQLNGLAGRAEADNADKRCEWRCPTSVNVDSAACLADCLQGALRSSLASVSDTSMVGLGDFRVVMREKKKKTKRRGLRTKIWRKKLKDAAP